MRSILRRSPHRRLSLSEAVITSSRSKRTSPCFTKAWSRSCNRSVFPPRPTPQTRTLRREHNRSRREVRALATRSVTPEEVGFAAATQIGRLRTRVRGCRRQSQETRYVISSADAQRLNTQGLLDTKRGYWA